MIRKTIKNDKKRRKIQNPAENKIDTQEQSCILSILAGQPVSEMRPASALSANDLFFIGRVDASEHKDFKMTYAQLSAHILADILSKLNLNSMAYKDEYEYSPVGHSHDYSKVRCYPSVTSSDIGITPPVDPRSQTEWLGSVSAWNGSSGTPEITDIYMPKPQTPEYIQPPVGELRVLALSAFPDSIIDFGGNLVYDPDLSGYWARPDGSIVNCGRDEFIEACKVYGVNGRTGFETSFRLPDIDGFLRLNPAHETSQPIKRVQFHNALSSHTHSIDTSSVDQNDTSICFKMRIYTCSAATGKSSLKKRMLHSGKGLIDSFLSNLTCDFTEINLSTDAFSTNVSYQGLDKESYPAHIRLPALVYIGRR